MSVAYLPAYLIKVETASLGPYAAQQHLATLLYKPLALSPQNCGSHAGSVLRPSSTAVMAAHTTEPVTLLDNFLLYFTVMPHAHTLAVSSQLNYNISRIHLSLEAGPPPSSQCGGGGG